MPVDGHTVDDAASDSHNLVHRRHDVTGVRVSWYASNGSVLRAFAVCMLAMPRLEFNWSDAIGSLVCEDAASGTLYS